MKRCWRFAWLLCCLIGSAQAAVVQDLYEASIAIDSQRNSAQQQAQREAMRQVLVKVRGNRDVLQSPAVTGKLSQAEDFLRQYRFETIDGQLHFHAIFDQQKVDELLRSAGFPIWGSRRPSTLLWFATENPEDQQRSLLYEQRPNDYSLLIQKAAKQRGIRINYPLLELDTFNNVGIYDVWGRFVDVLQQASEKYQVEAIIVARLYQMMPEKEEIQPQWQLDWNFALGQDREMGSLNGDSREQLLTQMVELQADLLASRFVIGGQGAADVQVVFLQFNNLEDIKTYVEVDRLLTSLSVVSSVTLKTLQGTQGIFEVRLMGSEQDLLNAISLERHIQRYLDPFGQPVSELQFIWAP
ncbi:DUF2066 domain-containing protein [Aliiglaciecola sp. CAU 1673]|uniref:DUF2066 domain-containing protein n=1 Tax=Aliiglaciecola sp. CAU 1673 TaxID=3032595 RepID=UPI0023D9CA1A|nr:DUF2066 domain-containing protein [Aliiglaciecola sp. CAU 1673]MDF2177566.1 DUF2066 domain-containing protein [Aliiglaciecola sp. CAU 1673]